MESNKTYKVSIKKSNQIIKQKKKQMQPPTIQSQLLKAQFPTQLYSPRTTYSNYLKQIQHLKTNMIINIDKYILGNLKTQFQKRNKQLTMVEFMYFSKKFLKDWNIQLQGRDVKMQECLNQLWQQIDKQNRGKIIWEEFNSKIIQTSLNLKSLSNNAGIQAPTFTQFGVPINPSKYESPISKIVYINKKHKMGYFRQQSTLIQFFPIESSSLPKSTQVSQTKPILLPQQQLKVQTMFKVKQKHQNNQLMQKSTKGLSKIIKKDIKVSSYKNTVLDAIYLNDLKYDMLLVSCSDKHIRGYNVQNLVPIIACQPQNEDQPMIHQFPVQIYNMAWDQINQVLYATSKGSTIYQWMVKTDSQRQMFDFKGHDGMISTIFMMSKLQLLATGGFDGRLILWDTVGQSVKMKYLQHTRAISAITFHQGLVLLFTSALDHKICVWNPYIGSLIHKIDNSLNIVQLQIIPNTSYLMSVDSGGNVKVRQINRFTQVVNFSIFRSQNADQTQKLINNTKPINSQKDKQINITMCSKRDNPILYYFGTDKIVGYKFNQIQKTSLNNNTGTIIEMKYSSKQMKLYTPMKNHIIVWNLLTGINQDTFYDMTEYDITAFQLVQDLGFFVVADTDGNVLQRNIINGSLISKLTRMKAPVKNIKLYQLQKNQGQKNPQSITRQYHLFCTTEQGDILVHKCSPKGQFQAHRHFSLRNDFSILNNNISTIDYYSQKYLLIIVLSTNQIVCIDVEKRSLLVKISLGDHLFEKMNVVQSQEKNFFLIVNSKHGQLMPFYLPPHNKKFKNAPLLTFQSKQIIQCSIYGPKTHTYFMVNENHLLLSFDLSTKLLDSQQSQQLSMKWKIKLQQRVLEMLLIQNQQILILLNQSENFTFISTQTGKIICHLSLEEMKDQFTNHTLIEPIFYFKPKTNEILISTPKQKIIKIEDNSTDSKMSVYKIIDPYYFINLLEQKNIENFNKISNTSWTLNFNLPKIVQKRINQINSIEDKINNFTKNSQLNGLSHFGSKIQKALELQKKWEKQKDNEPQQQEILNHQMLRKVNSVGRKSSTKFDISAFDKMMNQVTRGNSVSSLWKHAQKPKKYSQFSVHTESKAQQSRDGSKIKEFSHVQQIDFSKLQKDPLYRLGLALKNVNTRDRQAQNFIQLAKKKEQVKLPKINSQKIKL